jgi:hypothetical protein
MSKSLTNDTYAADFKNSSNERDETFQDAAHTAGSKVRSMLHCASDEISHAKEYVTDEIRSNPVRSGVIVLGLGLLLGALFRR